MSHDQISTPLTKDQAYALVDAVMERDDLALTASAHEDEKTGEWVFEATCASPPDLDAFKAIARSVLGGEVGFAVAPLDEETDWVARSLEGLHPVTAGGFYIYGSHELNAPPAGAIPIRIDAAQAFGTGHHDTTTGCLQAIEKILKRKRPMRPIDIGTGTGVLAIAIAKRRRVPVVASDIDPVAVKIARENAHINGVGQLIVDVYAAGLDHTTIQGNAPYDLIVANILAGPLVALAPGIGRIAERGCAIVLSGLLNTQAQRVIAAYRQQGMILRDRIVRNEWTTLTLEKA
ncbi:50S ribosomal protein L11 methyltransferase [Pelagibacterium xiamenense]|uniref:50S ribosomal protein L11 methyltransferase n=1 Tax=Pelagibacterium xiamenense TaxID=2901140 RepID=UPI001E590FE8|nr:50S ribosomal protein L11 methyltransferase [Pelagibacterium xiamenense]MCD7060112.1 50S ribosomal protein L11 methyltransferase [Pelagibacterium xiamenense]